MIALQTLPGGKKYSLTFPVCCEFVNVLWKLSCMISYTLIRVISVNNCSQVSTYAYFMGKSHLNLSDLPHDNVITLACQYDVNAFQECSSAGAFHISLRAKIIQVLKENSTQICFAEYFNSLVHYVDVNIYCYITLPKHIRLPQYEKPSILKIKLTRSLFVEMKLSAFVTLALLRRGLKLLMVEIRSSVSNEM
mgnify:CR=1 FL=1